MKQKIVSFLALFASAGTLICCALPALLVSLGMAAVVVSAISAFPWLVPLSQHKEWLFLGVGLLIGLNFWLVYRSRTPVVCNAETGASTCEMAGRWSRVVLWLSLGIFMAGISMAYLALPVVRVWGG
ncbi:MAG: hypothetical protein HY651_07030 [Acidobacteria bacterium]|nr:hypothetical protein [Acidobacteriota bacterium]